jgi:hypothetical protein
MIKIARNESDLDRVLRLIIGISFIMLSLLNTSFDNSIRIVFFILALMLVFTALTGFCGIYRLFGFSTCETSVKSRSLKYSHKKKK